MTGLYIGVYWYIGHSYGDWGWLFCLFCTCRQKELNHYGRPLNASFQTSGNGRKWPWLAHHSPMSFGWEEAKERMEQPSAHKMDLSPDHRHPSKACTGTYLLLVAPCIINTQGLGLYASHGSVWPKGWTCSGGGGTGAWGSQWGSREGQKYTCMRRCIHDG